MLKALLLLWLLQLSFEEPLSDSSEQIVKSLEHKLVTARRTVISKLDQCTPWRHNKIDEQERTNLERLMTSGKFENYKEFALRIARRSFPESEDCLRSLQFVIKKYTRILHLKRKYLGVNMANHIEDFLTTRQLNELHLIHKQTNETELMTKALNRFFDGLPEEKKKLLIKEFWEYKADLRRKPRNVRSTHSPLPSTTPSPYGDPDPFKAEWLKWMTPRHKYVISRMKSQGASSWEVQSKIGSIFYHLPSSKRRPYQVFLEAYCIKNLKLTIGETDYAELEKMYQDSDTVESIETKFQEIVGNLQDEVERVRASHYGTFCGRIYRLVPFEPTDLTSWLTTSQKFNLASMIQDPDIGDSQVYDKVYEYFSTAVGEQKEEAHDVIDTGCRHFIANMFGDELAEELEEQRLYKNASSQHLAASLASYATEISDSKDRKTAESTLPICTRIYLDYDGQCKCNGNSELCDHVLHQCQNCTGNTMGVQCENCMEGFTGNATDGGCTAVEPEVQCDCNHHSITCGTEGDTKCLDCLHNTEGDNCEKCKPGFYGDAAKGTEDDCKACPCPNSGACILDEDETVKCTQCPEGYEGNRCEKKRKKEDDSTESEEKEEKLTTRKHRQKIHEIKSEKIADKSEESFFRW